MDHAILAVTQLGRRVAVDRRHLEDRPHGAHQVFPLGLVHFLLGFGQAIDFNQGHLAGALDTVGEHFGRHLAEAVGVVEPFLAGLFQGLVRGQTAHDMERQEIAVFQFRVAVAAGHQGLGIAVGALEAQMDVVEPAGAGDGFKHLFGQRAVLVGDDVEDRHALQGARILAR